MGLMRAYWMTGSVMPGEVVDSRTFRTFRLRVLDNPVGTKDVSRVTFSDYAGSVLCETTLELVRLSEFPSRPSRLDSLFLWPTLELARDYHNRAPYAAVHEVEIRDSRNCFLGDFDLIHYYPSPLTLRGFIARARAYWRSGYRA